MEGNECETSHLDSDFLLPPRKRLLAGLKRQSSECTLQSSPDNSSPILSSEFDTRLNNLMKSHKNGTTMTLEEIAKAAGSAATAATKAAEAARAAAEEKAAIAAKAVAAAKNALDSVASFSEERECQHHNHQKKNKTKKQVPVQLLYRKKESVDNRGSDEELARKLHRAINSSPRISKHSLQSESKNKHKRLKISYEDSGHLDGVQTGSVKLASPYGEDGTVGGDMMESQPFYGGSYVAKGLEKGFKSRMFDTVEENIGDTELSHSKEKFLDLADDVQSNGRKRGRIKQKKLPLSFCSFKDQANPKEEMNQSSSVLTRATQSEKSNGSDLPTASSEPISGSQVLTEPTPTWKCQHFKVPQCIKPNKVVQS